MRKYCRLLLCVWLGYGSLQAQTDRSSLGLQSKNLYQLRAGLPHPAAGPALRRIWRPLHSSDFRPTMHQSPPNTSLDLTFTGKRPEAFFCRWEWEMERRTALPLRVRLGNLAYVNRLEQKNVFFPSEK